MTRKDFARLMTRGGGFCLLLLALQMLPRLVIAMPAAVRVIVTLNTLSPIPSWSSVIFNHGVLTLVRLILCFVTAFYLIGRGEWVIRWLAGHDR